MDAYFFDEPEAPAALSEAVTPGETKMFNANARAFQQQSGALRKAMWWKNAKMVATLMCFVLAVALVALMSVCGWSFRKCRAS